MSNRIYRVMSVKKSQPEKYKNVVYVGYAWGAATVKLLELSGTNLDEYRVFLDAFDCSNDKLTLVESFEFLPKQIMDVSKEVDNKDKVEFTKEELRLIQNIIGNTCVGSGRIINMASRIYNKLKRFTEADGRDDILPSGDKWPRIYFKEDWPEGTFDNTDGKRLKNDQVHCTK